MCLYSPAAPPSAEGLPAWFLNVRCPQPTLPGDASKRVTTLFGDGHESRTNPDHHIGAFLDRRLADVAAQQELGLLSEWRIGSHPSHRPRAAAPWEDLGEQL